MLELGTSFQKSSAMRLEEVHIKNINAGDTLIHNENLKTVGQSDIQYCSFMGPLLFGDAYHLGHKPVIKVTFLCD